MFGERGSNYIPEMSSTQKSDQELSQERKMSLPSRETRLAPVVALLTTLGGGDALAKNPDQTITSHTAHERIERKSTPTASKKVERKEKIVPISLSDTTLGREFEQQLLKLPSSKRKILRARWNEIVQENTRIILTRRFHSETGRPAEARLNERFEALLRDPKFPRIVRLAENFCFAQHGNLGKTCRDLILGVILEESDFDLDEVSRAGAKGLMQIMPNASETKGFKDKDFINPSRNIFAGGSELRNKHDVLNGRFGAALIAYNEGMGSLFRQLEALGLKGVFQKDRPPTLVELYDALTGEDAPNERGRISAHYPFRVAFYEHQFRLRAKQIDAVAHPPKPKTVRPQPQAGHTPVAKRKSAAPTQLVTLLNKRSGARGK